MELGGEQKYANVSEDSKRQKRKDNTVLNDPPSIPICEEDASRWGIGHYLHDFKNGKYVDGNFTLWKTSEDLNKALFKRCKNDPRIVAYAQQQDALKEKQFQADFLKVSAVKSTHDGYVKKRADVSEVVLNDLEAQFKDQGLVATLKHYRKPITFDTNNSASWVDMNPEDALRSIENLRDQLLPLMAQLKKDETETKSLIKKRDKVASERDEVAKRLKKENLSKDEFREIESELNFYNNELSNIVERLQTIAEHGATPAIEAIDHKIQVLNCLSDRDAIPGSVGNFEKRKTRLLQSIRQHLSDRDGLQTLNDNINSRFKELTGSPIDICKPLALRVECEHFFV